jgi:hypothetical protein
MSYARVSILGTFPGGEKWSINPCFDPEGELGTIPGQAGMDAAVVAINGITVPGSLTTLMGSGVSLVGSRLEIRDDNTDALLGLSQANRATAVVGVGSLKLPTQSAIVASLRTNTPGGRGRGRVYWPATGAVLGTDGRLSSPTTAAIVADLKTYFKAIESALALGQPTAAWYLSVRSSTAKATPHVARIQVGDVIDTQRRRRDAYVEAYQSVTY